MVFIKHTISMSTFSNLLHGRYISTIWHLWAQRFHHCSSKVSLNIHIFIFVAKRFESMRSSLFALEISERAWRCLDAKVHEIWLVLAICAIQTWNWSVERLLCRLCSKHKRTSALKRRCVQISGNFVQTGIDRCGKRASFVFEK